MNFLEYKIRSSSLFHLYYQPINFLFPSIFLSFLSFFLTMFPSSPSPSSCFLFRKKKNGFWIFSDCRLDRKREREALKEGHNIFVFLLSFSSLDGKRTPLSLPSFSIASLDVSTPTCTFSFISICITVFIFISIFIYRRLPPLSFPPFDLHTQSYIVEHSYPFITLLLYQGSHRSIIHNHP